MVRSTLEWYAPRDGDAVRAIVTDAADVTDARQTVRVAALAREALGAAIDGLTSHAFVTWDGDGIITSWNAGAAQLFEASRGQTVGQPLTGVFPTADAAVHVLQDLAPIAGAGPATADRWLRHRNGTRRHVRITLARAADEGGSVGATALFHEVPPPAAPDADPDTLARQMAQTSQQLADANARLTAEIADHTQAEAARLRLLRRLVVAQEEERRRIARDLHDGLGQRLIALRLTLEGLPARGDASVALSKALTMIAAIDEGLDFLAWELRPAALDELGLTKVLEHYVQGWSRHAGVPAVFHTGTTHPPRCAPEVEASVYRIAQEALNNVAKHAQARTVNVVLEHREDLIVLVVEDDGVGCHPVGPQERRLGLTGMRERAIAVGGVLEIEPTPQGGTTVLARIPSAPPPAGGRRPRGWRDDEEAGAAFGPSGPGASAPSDAEVHRLRARVQDLQHAVAARDEFIATVAHELRNPVAPLMFQVRLGIEKVERQVAAQEPVPPEWVHAQLRRMEQRLHRLLETLDRLLDVSRLSTGRIDLQPERVDLAQVVREVVSTFDAELAVARCAVVVSAPGDATGWWDRLRLEQICRNLLSNAIRFGAGRPIALAIGADADLASLEVRDQGVGIAADLHARIFERFERGVEQRSGGFGIGLWVVKNICVAMGGTIAVESEVGHGACFTVVLPRRPAPADASLGEGA